MLLYGEGFERLRISWGVFGLQIAARFLVPLLRICCAGAGRFPVSCVAACYVYAFWRMTVNGMHVYDLNARLIDMVKYLYVYELNPKYT